jgi:hypothetical protein
MTKPTTLVLTALLVASAGLAYAQQMPAAPADARWQPWVGCWQLLDEHVRNHGDISSDPVAAASASARLERSGANTRVCVARAEQGVSLTTMVGDQRVLDDSIVADGVNHPITDNECRGSKRSEWSKTGYRLYTTAEISCADQPPRKVSGLTMMMTGPTWVDIQLIDIEGRKNIRVRKFTRATPVARGAGTFAGENSWSVADVKEASVKLMPEAVQAALVELGTGFNVKSKQLTELADAGVASNVIDLMIALSYPKHFVVERSVSGGGGAPYSFGGSDYGDYLGVWPWIADAMFWPSYYSPFAYRYWGYYDPYHVPNSGYVVIEPPGGGSTPVASGTGRVVDGRGYTRVTTREPQPVPRDGSNGGNGNGSTGSSSGSSGGSVTSGGYSSGGADSGGRTAVSRPPGY